MSFQTLLNTSNPSTNSMGSIFKIRLKINHFYLPPHLRTTILSVKLNSFPTGLPTFALVLLQATKQSEQSFRKVNHVNSMMSFFSLEPPVAVHLTYCVSQIPCHSCEALDEPAPLFLHFLNLQPLPFTH